mgnify:CR=1 FL=1
MSIGARADTQADELFCAEAGAVSMLCDFESATSAWPRLALCSLEAIGVDDAASDAESLLLIGAVLPLAGSNTRPNDVL